MPRKVVVILDSKEGRELVRRKCREIKLKMPIFERLVEAELDQQGKQRKRGLREEFDEILDEDAGELTL
jgi:hypothetical protein